MTRSELHNTIPLVDERHLVKALILDAASRNELFISYARLIIVSLVLARFLILNPPVLTHLIVVPTAIFSLGYSIFYIVIHRNKTATMLWLWVSVCIDAVVYFISMISDVLNPWPEYPGILFIPDAALILIVCFASGMRLNTNIALVGGLINIVSLLLLAGCDQLLNSKYVVYSWSPIAMWLIMLISATIVAIISTARTQSLAIKGAYESVRLERMRSGVKSVLEGHHDAHSLLSSVNLYADQLIRRVPGQDADISKYANYLKDDIQALTSCLSQVKHSSDSCINSSLEPTPVLLNEAIPKIISKLQLRMKDLNIDLNLDPQPISIQLAGGVHSLNRIFVNLLQNAIEGDGDVGARDVRINLNRGDHDIALTVDDDGPGFELSDDLTKEGSGKTTGFNVGLTSVSTIVDASGGQMTFDHSDLGGARISIRFPC